MAQKTFVTKPDLPPLEEFLPYLHKIWDTKILTNGGQFHQELENELCKYLGVPYISLFTNGTIALVTALKALNITGEVITTPFSFVATSHSLIWNNLQPVFIDIDPVSLNLNPRKIEAAITPKTEAILGVHCYGRPCDVEAINNIAVKYNLKVIYDAAHAFGVRDQTQSILNYGNLSVLSFHATKVFNTFEGGAIVSHDQNTKTLIDQLKNFGILDELNVITTGINGKMSELNSALGLVQLKYIDQAISKRSLIDAIYRKGLGKIAGIKPLESMPGIIQNYSYFPVLVNSEYKLTRDKLYSHLLEHGIYSRKYFYPLITDHPMYSNLESASVDKLPVARFISDRILCLPIYPDLEPAEVLKICEIIANI